MSPKDSNQLLDRYYLGETSLDEEKKLRDEASDGDDSFLEETDMFNYFKQESAIPDGFQQELFEQIQFKEKQSKIIRLSWLKYSSIAASVCLFASVFWFTIRSQSPAELTNDQQFAILEQALLQASNGVQPPQDDMLVLFQDENLEIVMK